MPVYRLEIERGDTLWVIAHDERGAIELASAHVAGDVALEGATLVKLTNDADEALIFRAPRANGLPLIERLDSEVANPPRGLATIRSFPG